MDYKYIEQLLDRYWECHASIDEERILQSFFRQKDLPEHLARFAPLFEMIEDEKQQTMTADIDVQLITGSSQTSQPAEVGRGTKARRLLVRTTRLMQPFFKAAAAVAIIFMIGTAAEHAIVGSTVDDELAQPLVSGTYVRSSEVEALITPEQKTTDVTAATNSADSLSTKILPIEMQKTEE